MRCVEVNDEIRPRSFHAATNCLPKRITVTHTMRGRQHVNQAEMLARPLRRRLARMLRPARVRMRRRKPCFLARRRLFGWYVRLLTGRSFVTMWPNPAAVQKWELFHTKRPSIIDGTKQRYAVVVNLVKLTQQVSHTTR